MSKFKIGDEVRVLPSGLGWDASPVGRSLCGRKGVVCDRGYSGWPGVHFPDIEKLPELHNCNGYCPDGTGYYLNEKYLARIEKPKQTIVITNDGKTTRAVLREGKRTVREATAICHDRDTFDLETGAYIAFKRLFGWTLDSDEPLEFSRAGKPKLYNAKVVCVSAWDDGLWTPGKVYEIKDNIITDDVWCTHHVVEPLTSNGVADFIPFVEG